MKNVMFAVMAIGLLAGCTPKSVDFMESMQVEGQHDKALEFLGTDRSKSGMTYIATPKAKQCLRDKMVARGYYVIQDDIDCWDNEVK